MSSLADEEASSTADDANDEERESNVVHSHHTEEANSDSTEERHYSESGSDISQEETDAEGDGDDNNSMQEVIDIALDIHRADEQNLLRLGPRDICGPTLALPSSGQAVGIECEGGGIQGSDRQPPGGGDFQVLDHRPPGVTQTGGYLVSDLSPSFSTFIICYCAVLAALIISAADIDGA